MPNNYKWLCRILKTCPAHHIRIFYDFESVGVLSLSSQDFKSVSENFLRLEDFVSAGFSIFRIFSKDLMIFLRLDYLSIKTKTKKWRKLVIPTNKRDCHGRSFFPDFWGQTRSNWTGISSKSDVRLLMGRVSSDYPWKPFSINGLGRYWVRPYGFRVEPLSRI